MHRLQISLPEWQYRFLREQASRTGQSIAGFIRELIEQPGDAQITDLHVWRVGPNARAAIVSVLGQASTNADSIRERLKPVHEVSHLTVEFRSA
jgi:Co/Zn/Cd efflux system component